MFFLHLTCRIQFGPYFKIKVVQERVFKKAEQRWWNRYKRNGGIGKKKILVCRREGKMNELKKVSRK